MFVVQFRGSGHSNFLKYGHFWNFCMKYLSHSKDEIPKIPFVFIQNFSSNDKFNKQIFFQEFLITKQYTRMYYIKII